MHGHIQFLNQRQKVARANTGTPKWDKTGHANRGLLRPFPHTMHRMAHLVYKLMITGKGDHPNTLPSTVITCMLVYTHCPIYTDNSYLHNSATSLQYIWNDCLRSAKEIFLQKLLPPTNLITYPLLQSNYIHAPEYIHTFLWVCNISKLFLKNFAASLGKRYHLYTCVDIIIDNIDYVPGIGNYI